MSFFVNNWTLRDLRKETPTQPVLPYGRTIVSVRALSRKMQIFRIIFLISYLGSGIYVSMYRYIYKEPFIK